MERSLSEAAELAVSYVNSTGRHVFLTGKAGSGKTTLLRYLVDNTYKKVAVAAPTGIAAINARGVTLHSLLQLPFGTYVPEDVALPNVSADKVNTPRSVVSQMQMNKSKRNLFSEIELLIIDEVSMLRADLLDCIDTVLRHVRRNKEPFGGIQMLFIGDMNQLPPVVRHSEWSILSKFYKSAFFFDATVFAGAQPVFIELDKVYRQSDPTFVGLLNRLRDNNLNAKDITLLNSRYKEDIDYSDAIHITTHNRKADSINDGQLGDLSGATKEYKAVVDGEFPESMFPLPEKLVLKEGAQVMFVKNDGSGEGKYYNGKIGTVNSLSKDSIEVQLEGSGDLVELEKYKWENKRYKLNAKTGEVEEKLMGTFEQYPLKLAWAITVHKSQGLTFDKAVLDLSESFAPGQMYVALSRLTALEGLQLSKPIPEQGIGIDPQLKEFAKQRPELSNLRESLEQDKEQFLILHTQRSFDFSMLQREVYAHLQSFNKDATRSTKQKHKEWTNTVYQEITQLTEVGRKFGKQLAFMAHKGETGDSLHERVIKATGYFLPLMESLSKKIEEQKKKVRIQKQVKGYYTELKELALSMQLKVMQLKKAELLISTTLEGKALTKDILKGIKSTRIDAGEEKKVSTKDVTFDLYKAGKSIEEIASERELTEGTIQGHLCHFVNAGELKATDLMDEAKMKDIIKVSETLKSTSLSEIKGRLGDEYEYGEIKIAMAHLEYTKAS